MMQKLPFNLTTRVALLSAALLFTAAPAPAQMLRAQPASAYAVERAIVTATLGSFESAAADISQKPADRPGGLRPMRVAKWSVLAVATGAGIYGFVQNNEADDRFRELEQLCQDQQFRCARRTPGGEYADAEFEDLYQNVKRLDGRSHIALLFSQVGLATGAALFLLDLGNAESPDDIPWVPTAKHVNGRVELGFSVPVALFRP